MATKDIFNFLFFIKNRNKSARYPLANSAFFGKQPDDRDDEEEFDAVRSIN
ncbi:MAG: hypothetical protein ACOVQX_00720 [Legionella sp.]